MILRNFKILRNEKLNSFIQITGLTLGLIACIFIGQSALFEYSYDKFNKDYPLIYRTKGTEGMLLGTIAKDHLSYIESFARLHPSYRGVTIITNNKSFYENKSYYADGALFDIFTFPIAQGNAREALNHKNQMVISERYAVKYFGEESPIGKTLLVNGAYESNIIYTIAGVFKNIPQNSHLQFDILFSMENILANKMYTEDEPWRWQNFFTYFKTKKPIDTEQFHNDLITIALKNGMDKGTDGSKENILNTLDELHLNGQINYMDNNQNTSDIKMRILIVLIILTIAWLNFINLGIGNMFKNNLEITVKRMLGASSYNIWSELFRKSIVLSFVAFIVSLLLYSIINYAFQNSGVLPTVQLSSLMRLIFWSSIVFIQISGAFFVSTVIFILFKYQKSAKVISTRIPTVKNKQSPWVTVFVLQFVASIVLISFALYSTRHIEVLMHKETGIQTSQILAIHSANYAKDSDIELNRSVFEQEVQKISGVSTATSSSYIPGSVISSYMPTRLTWKNEKENIDCRMNFVGYNYIPLFGHKLLAGRNFSKEFATDGVGIIINETLVKEYGFENANEAIGKEIFWEFRNVNRKIIGVIEDFYHQSADMAVEPTLFQLWDHARGFCLLKINTTNTQKTIKEIEKLWEKIHAGNAFDYLWVDAHYQLQFAKWIRYVKIIKALSLLAILIACIGLFGLSTMLLTKRTKEIGIRKVNGARIPEVIVLLNKDFIKWVIIAFIIACPIAWYAMHKWNENFAYKTELSWWIFVAAGAAAVTIALLTVSWQTWRAARRNPVEALRYE